MALECLSLEDAAVVAYVIVILLFEHVARPYPVYALLALLDRQSLMQVLAEYEHFVVFCHLLQAVAVQLGRLREVSCFNRLVLEAVELKKFKELLVATVSEHSLLNIADVVHFQTSNEGDLDSETSVRPSTVEADVNSIVNRDPLGTFSLTLKAIIV